MSEHCPHCLSEAPDHESGGLRCIATLREQLRRARGLLEDTVNVLDHPDAYGPGGILTHRNRVRAFLSEGSSPAPEQKGDDDGE